MDVHVRTMEVSNTESSHQLLGVQEKRVQPSSSSKILQRANNTNVKGRNRKLHQKIRTCLFSGEGQGWGLVRRRLKDGAVRIKAEREAHGRQFTTMQDPSSWTPHASACPMSLRRSAPRVLVLRNIETRQMM